MSDQDSLTFSRLTQTHIQRLKDAFQTIDDDGDGAISQKDLDKTYKSIGRKMKPEQLESMLSASKDKDDEGITFPEFLSIMGETMGKYPEDTEIVNCLKVLSGNEELNVPLDEMLNYLKDAGYPNAEREFEKLFKEFTSDQDFAGRKVFKGKQFMNTISE